MSTSAALSTLAAPAAPRVSSPARDFLRRIRRSWGAKIGFSVLLLLIGCALLAPFIAPFDPVSLGPDALAAPSAAHFFGTDFGGRDIFSRVLFGARLSLLVGLISVSIASLIGVSAGLLAGFYGGWTDMLLMRTLDVMLAFPGILLALAIVSMLGPGLFNLMIAVGISAIPGYARITRGSVLSAREELYVQAALSIGVPNGRIMLLHILPNIFAPILVAATLGIGTAMWAAAALSFIGLGDQPSTPEWGRMLSEGRQYLRDQAWIATFPGLAIMLSVLAMNLLGDGLRDALDPRLKN
ncbi:MAG: ABC transporter permease [Chloroflexi bacterium]|nr:ABC transporter permease [Chloroflexota bacterium]